MKSTMKANLLIIGVIFSVSLVLFAFTTSQQKPWVVPVKYKNMKNPTKADKGNLAIGKSLYNKHCKSCHGINRLQTARSAKFEADVELNPT